MARILIAEDDPDIRELLRFTLMFADHEVTACANGAEAVAQAPDADPELILMDVRMPHMTGYEACRHLRADPRFAHTPVVFLTAKGQDEEIEQGRSVGATAYLVKPFSPDDLLARIAAILAERR